jgi:F420-dependent oxidoreductase-like protein
MDLSIHVIRFDWPGAPASIAPALARVGAAADSVGAVSVSLMDHYFQMDRMWPADQPMLEGYSGLNFLAAHTSRVRLGLLVTGVTYRHPGLLAKIVTTLDVLSGGRSELGIGAAWYEREHRALGVPFPPVAERFERLEETLQICLQMWSDNDGPYQGRHYQLAETLCSPEPISRPHPRITIGGTGERKTLRFVATYGDACNLFAASHDMVAHKLDVLRRHCDAVGRDHSEITKTILHMGGLDASNSTEFLRDMERYAALGVQEVHVVPHGDEPDRWIETVLGPIAKSLAELTAAP